MRSNLHPCCPILLPSPPRAAVGHRRPGSAEMGAFPSGAGRAGRQGRQSTPCLPWRGSVRRAGSAGHKAVAAQPTLGRAGRTVLEAWVEQGTHPGAPKWAKTLGTARPGLRRARSWPRSRRSRGRVERRRAARRTRSERGQQGAEGGARRRGRRKAQRACAGGGKMGHGATRKWHRAAAGLAGGEQSGEGGAGRCAAAAGS